MNPMPVIQNRELDVALDALASGTSRDPFSLLGPHADQRGGVMIRAVQPAAKSIEVRLIGTGELISMTRRGDGPLFEAVVDGGGDAVPDYRLRVTFPNNYIVELDD